MRLVGSEQFTSIMLRVGRFGRVCPLLLLIATAGPFLGAGNASAEAVPANGRAWELITPGEPVAAQPSGAVFAEGDDSRVLYSSLGPMPGAASGAPLANVNLAERDGAEWTSMPIGFPFSVYANGLLQLVPLSPIAFSPDRLSSLWISAVPLTPDAPPEEKIGLYHLGPDSKLVFVAEVSGGGFGSAFFEGFTELPGDGGQAIFSSPKHILPADTGRTSGESLYQWNETGLRLVDVTTAGSLLSACGSKISHSNGVSANGSRIFFANLSSEACPGPKRVYLREDGSVTVEISASQCTRADCNAPADVAFAGATPDGGHAFLTTSQQLTNDDVDETRDLYDYDVGSGVLTLLTVAQPEANGEVLGELVHPSMDGGRVYFSASGRLVTSQGPTTGTNLYVVDQAGLRFICPIETADRIQLSDDGQKALLSTNAGLVEGDTDGRKDVYLYDAVDQAVTWLSTGPVGGNASVDANIKTPLGEAEGFIQISLSYAPGRAITSTGDRSFFSTAESLTPADVNETTDVYEWAAGNLGLVSSGTASTNVRFGGISADGRTALFETAASLTAGDRDGGDPDYYVARIGGGFPSDEAKPGGSEVSPQPRPPVRQVPASATSLTSGRERVLRLIGMRAEKSAHHTQRIIVLLGAPNPGRVSALVWGHRRHDERVVLAHGSAGAIRPGKVEVQLRLTGAGKQTFAQRHRLDGLILIRQGSSRLYHPFHLNRGA